MMALDVYLRQALKGFQDDPADTDFQRGYEAALREVAKVFHPELLEASNTQNQ